MHRKALKPICKTHFKLSLVISKSKKLTTAQILWRRQQHCSTATMTWRTIQSGGPLFAKALWSLWSLWWMVMVRKRVGSVMKIKKYLLRGSGTPLSSLLADLTPLLIWWQVWWFNDWLVCRHRLISKCNNGALLAEETKKRQTDTFDGPIVHEQMPIN